MSTPVLSRRQLLKVLAGISVSALAAPALAACQPRVVEVTREVEKVVAEKAPEAVPQIRFLTGKSTSS